MGLVKNKKKTGDFNVVDHAVSMIDIDDISAPAPDENPYTPIPNQEQTNQANYGNSNAQFGEVALNEQALEELIEKEQENLKKKENSQTKSLDEIKTNLNSLNSFFKNIIGHVKVRDIIDPVTNATYTTLTTDMAQRDFNAFKNKMHLVGIGCIDRTIETEGTGRKNIVTHKEVTVNKVKSETRKIVFRDDNYSVDSKSRFANIVNEIPFDPDEFIKAVKDAIAASKSSHSPATVVSPAKAEPIAENPIEEPVNPDDTEFEKIQMEEIEKDEPDVLFGMNEPEEAETSDYPEDLDKVVAEMFKGASPSLKTKAKDIIKQYGKFKDVDEDGLKEMYDLLK